jgi:hypothetical protein
MSSTAFYPWVKPIAVISPPSGARGRRRRVPRSTREQADLIAGLRAALRAGLQVTRHPCEGWRVGTRRSHMGTSLFAAGCAVLRPAEPAPG